MSSILLPALVVFSGLLILSVFFFYWYKQNAHTELYSEGVRNENEGRYVQALHNYEDALSEIRKLRLSKKFGQKIDQRIKVLRTIINYEQIFQTDRIA
jgi:hypothetical protein